MKMKWGFTGRSASLRDLTRCVGPGWTRLIKDLVKDITAMGWDGEIFQVKEKFGGLRAYIGSASDEIRERIDQAERLSYFICERCGKQGLPRGPGWYKTLCETHAKKAGATEILATHIYIYEGEHKIVATISIDPGERKWDDEESERRN